jgi:hypothetical protein
MSSRRSTRLADAAEREAAARSARIVAAGASTPVLYPLPYALALVILGLLPADCRLLCAEVSRAWRAALLERRMWLRLNLSTSGVSPEYEGSDALLRAAAARAGGQLYALDVGKCSYSDEALLAVITRNGGTLRELRDMSYRDGVFVNALLRAAPQLVSYAANVRSDDFSETRRMLRNEGTYGPLRLHGIELTYNGADAQLEAETLVAFAADLATHASLERLWLVYVPFTRATLDAVVDAALAVQMSEIMLLASPISTLAAPALTRLVTGGTRLHTLVVEPIEQLLDTPTATALGNALRANSTLKTFELGLTYLWNEPAAAVALLGALTDHPSVEVLNLGDNDVDETSRAAAGTSLAALVAANAPALRKLNVHNSNLGDAGLAELFDALPHNTHLRKLSCMANELTEAFVRDRLLPAVRANTSLRYLVATCEYKDEENVGAVGALLRQAEAHVAARRGAGEDPGYDSDCC